MLLSKAVRILTGASITTVELALADQLLVTSRTTETRNDFTVGYQTDCDTTLLQHAKVWKIVTLKKLGWPDVHVALINNITIVRSQEIDDIDYSGVEVHKSLITENFKWINSYEDPLLQAIPTNAIVHKHFIVNKFVTSLVANTLVC